MNSAPQSRTETPLIITGLSLSVSINGEKRPLLAGIDLSVSDGEIVGLVGESGSGKSLTSRAAIGLLPRGSEVDGSVLLDGIEVLGASGADLLTVRRHRAAMVFQDPRSSVNPVRRVGDFLTEGLRAQGISNAVARERCIQLLGEVGIRNPEAAMSQYPHEFSGGMLQRIVIAAALSIRPRVLLADEATTALDVTTQAEVVSLLRDLQAETGTGMLFVTHDLELAAALCDRVYVMYAGRVVESAHADDLFAEPQHPYTVGLLNSNPRLDGEWEPLTPITGRPLALAEAPTGCAFRDRCPIATAACAEEIPPLRPYGSSNVACIHPGEAKVA